MNISKKLSVVALAVTTIMWATGAMFYTPTVARAAVAGDLIKAPIGGAAVYYLAADGKRYTFPNSKIYNSWYADFSGVKMITDSELTSYSIGGNVHYRPGTRLVKITTDPKVYAVTPGGVLRQIPDEATAAALYGSTWNQQIDDLPDAFFAPPNYTIGTPLATGGSELPVGYLAKDSANQNYYIASTGKRPVANQAAMDANRFWSKFVFTPPASALSALSSGTSVTAAETSLIDSSEYTLRTGGSTVPTGGNVTVSLAADTPPAASLPDGTIYNPVVKFNVTASADGEARLTSVTVTRGGFIANSNVNGISVWDQNGLRHGSILTALTSDGKGTISFSGSPIIIPAGQTRSVTVAFNLSANTNSATVNGSIVAATDLVFTGSPIVNGTFPLTGNMMSVVDGSSSLGSVTVSGQSVGGLSSEPSSSTSGNLEVGQTQMEVAKFNFSETASKEDVQMRQLTFYVEGDITETTDLANYTVYAPDGTVLGSAAKSENRYATVTLTNPYTIAQGQNRNLTVKVDVLNGANRWFRLQLQNDYDLLIRGVTTGANLQPTSSAFDAGSSWTAISSTSGYFKIKQGAMTIAKNSASPSGNLSVGSNNVELARFDITANGENLEVQKIGIQSNNFYDLSGNISIVDASNGTVYFTGTANATTSYNTSGYTVQTSLSNYISLNVGTTKTIKVMGNIRTAANSNNTVRIGLGNAYVRRLSTLDYTNVATGGTLANSLTIGTTSMTVTKHTTPPDPSTLAPGTTSAVLATFAVSNNASGAEDVRFNSINIRLDGTNYAAGTHVSNMKLYDMTDATPVQLGSTLNSLTSSSNSFTVNWTVAKNTTRILGVKIDMASSFTSGGTIWAYMNSGDMTGTATGSNNTVTAPSATTLGQTQTALAASARVYFEQESATNSKIVIAGSQNVELGKLRFDISNEDVDLYKISYRVSTTAAATGTWAQAVSGTRIFTTFELWNGSTRIAGPVAVSTYDSGLHVSSTSLGRGASSTADVVFSLTSPLRLSRGVGGTVSLRANFVNSGSGVTTTVFSAGLKSNANTDLELRAPSTGLLAATSIQTTSTSAVTTQSNNYLFIDAAPVVVSLPVSGAHIRGGTDEVARFEVRNYSQVPILLTSLGVQFTGSLTYSGAATDTVAGFDLYDDSGTLIANPTTEVALCGGTSSTLVGATGNSLCGQGAAGAVLSTNLSTSTAFRIDGSVNGGFEANRTIPAASGSNYGYRVFSIRASTTNALAAGGTTARNVTVQVTGTRGYLSDGAYSVSSTPSWNTGGLQYKFIPMEYTTYTLDQDASDSYPLTSAAVTL